MPDLTARIVIILDPLTGGMQVQTQNVNPVLAFGMLELAKINLIDNMKNTPQVIPVSAIKSPK